MTAITIAARRAHAASAPYTTAERWSSLSHLALLAWAALFGASALRIGADAGPMHLFELVFFLGGLVLVVGLGWLLPFAGALLTASLGAAAWLFLDAEPENAWLGLAGLATALVSLGAWISARRATARSRAA